MIRLHLYVENDQEKEQVQAIINRVAAERALEQAAAARFGAEQAMTLRRPTEQQLQRRWEQAREQVKDNKAIVTLGGEISIPMIRVDDVWKIAVGRYSLESGVTAAEEIARERRIREAVEATIENVNAGHYANITLANTALDNRLTEAWRREKKPRGK